MTALKDIPVYTDEGRLTAVAFYGERLGRWLLHLPLPSWDGWLADRGKDHFDLDDADGARVSVEIKMANNKDRIVLYADQIENQLSEPSFPIEDRFVLIFHYKNQGPGIRLPKKYGTGTYLHHPRLLKEKAGKTWSSLSRFLASGIYRADLVDIEILRRWIERNGTYEFARYGKHNPFRENFPPRPVVPFTRTNVRHLVHDTRVGLATLGFNDAEIARWLPPGARRTLPRRITTSLDGNPLEFECTFLVPNGVKHRVLRRLNGSVSKMPPSPYLPLHA